MQTQTVEPERSSKLKKLFTTQLRDIYWAENKLVKKIHKLSDAATTVQLKEALDYHLTETRGHVNRLEKVFDLIDEKAEGKKCPAIAGIVEEGEEIIEETDEGSAQRDVGIILIARKAEHYEIATYGCLAQLAKTLGYTAVNEILGTTLNEEKRADERLAQIAETGINYKAAQETILL
jgi:ferritin-like metal-binding protein YciE